MYRLHLLWISSIISLISFIATMNIPGMPSMDNLDKVQFKGKQVSQCVACQNLVKSFLAAVEETTRQSFAGGDADWEKQKLGTYEDSELRFIEIQEMLCSDVELGKDQCYNLAEQYESELEDWFYEKRKKNVDLHESFCIEHLKVCCPKNTFGPKCIPCPGGIEKPCGGHGKCMKGGTREEPATCFCDAGYTGDLCDKCDRGYYQEPDVPVLLCKICDRSCKDHCRGPGPRNCEVCGFGYHFIPNEGCIEHLDNYKNEMKIFNESDGIDSMNISGKINEVDHINTSNVSSNNEGEELHLETNMDDSTMNLPHSEL